jgi:hypothetical protein
MFQFLGGDSRSTAFVPPNHYSLELFPHESDDLIIVLFLGKLATEFNG